MAVEQVDREAAADYIDAGKGTPGFADAMRTGSRDRHALVQAFAAHRERERERCAALADALLASDAPQFEAPCRDEEPELYGFGSACVRIATAIREGKS